MQELTPRRAGQRAGPLRTQLVPTSRAAWWVITGGNVLVLVLGALTTGRRARASAHRNADLLREEPVLV